MTKQLSGWKRRLFVALRAAVVAYLVILLAMVLLEPRLLFPGAYREVTPAATSLPTAWSYTAADGSEIVGQLIEHPDAERTVLFLHGNATYASRQVAWAEQISRLWKANVLAAEYRGFVDDQLTPGEANLTADAISAFDALQKHYGLNPQDIIVYGRSLGGGCAAAVAAEREIKHLVLDRTFDSAANVGARRYPFIPVHLLMRNPFDSMERLQSYDGTLVQVHGTNDSIVPYPNGRHLFETLTTVDKYFIRLEPFDHLDPMSDKTLMDILGYLSSQDETSAELSLTD
ncbi:alpha/beta hydrolase [Rhodopirellula sp. MGV]|uniref:alpha/beta hydrolase n=1 Tax=Rhodopirellula sp. MGV TaxID=2023130 RepID=UPI000B972599|nr:alpha/beta hydrolase [Rhodopirellula sp. MGV]OYP34233.1 hypothetical protein CGZ80_15740 [Rhodopirellula sp. MGV]PNY35022.1 alpha/beta hydrolase [Rhodopirellula baltica]